MSGEDSSLAALEAHGLAFLQSFGLPATVTKKSIGKRPGELSESPRASKKRRRAKSPTPDNASSSQSEQSAAGDESASSEESASEEEDEEEDEFQAAPQVTTKSRQVEVISFDQPRYNTTQSSSKASQRSFMSSKISRVVQDPSALPRISQNDGDDEEQDIDRSNTKNDAELFKLLHTGLLSSTSNPSLILSSAQHKKNLEGRVMELANRSKLGKGEKDVRSAEKKKNPLRIRVGMKEKQKMRDEKMLEEAKNVGNYHPALKKLFGPSTSSDEQKPAAKRDRGLSMGIGKHTSSGLKISKDEISRVNESTSHMARRGGGGGRGRGRGGGRGGGGRGGGTGKRR